MYKEILKGLSDWKSLQKCISKPPSLTPLEESFETYTLVEKWNINSTIFSRFYFSEFMNWQFAKLMHFIKAICWRNIYFYWYYCILLVLIKGPSWHWTPRASPRTAAAPPPWAPAARTRGRTAPRACPRTPYIRCQQTFAKIHSAWRRTYEGLLLVESAH